MQQRMEMIKQIQSIGSTHDCPECTRPTYCAMEDGKSANLCWCMFEKVSLSVDKHDRCVCKTCLNKDHL